MTPTVALAALLWLHPKQDQPAAVSAFQPQFHISLQSPVSRAFQRDGDREIICGMVVIHKTPAQDPKILLPPRETGAAVRRIEPHTCGATIVPLK